MTPQGVLYEKEAILECLLNQKKEYARKLALYEAASAGEAREAEAAARAAEEARLEQFHRVNNGGGPLPGGAGGAGGASAQADASRELNAFWVPSKTPHAASHADKPSSDTLCPATGKKLRMKELTPVRFTRVPGEAPEDGARFMCPTCKEVS
jgi:nitric oxide synthase-interacting protein